MRIQGLEQFYVGLAICSTAFVFSEVAVAQITTKQVETYTAGGVVNFSMPGTPAGAGLTFASDASVQSLDFTAGSVSFLGQPIDFDGHEAAFLSSIYQATVDVPVHSGPGTITVSGTGTLTSGTGGGGGGGCLVVGGPINIGPTFSSSRLDVALGGSAKLKDVTPNWNSSDVPQLNGHAVTVDGSFSVTSVDAINGIVGFTSSGKILAGSDVVPALTTLGSICLAVGLFGLAILALSRRALWGRDSSA